MEQSNHHGVAEKSESWLFSRTGIATILVLSVLGFLIYTDHSAHMLGYLPYALILACPLMHIFMHGGHGGHDHGGGEGNAPKQQRTADASQPISAQKSNQKNKDKTGGCH